MSGFIAYNGNKYGALPGTPTNAKFTLRTVWKGLTSGGTIPFPNCRDYPFIVVRDSGGASYMLYQNASGTRFDGGNIYTVDSSVQTVNIRLDIASDGNSVLTIGSDSLLHNASGNHGPLSGSGISEICVVETVGYVRNEADPPGAGAHNCRYRGKDIGTTVTAEQYAAIQSGTFDDLYIGDYWTIGGVVYRIAAFDYFYNTGDTALTVHHVTIVPDEALYDAQMNATNITTGGYAGSVMYTANLAQAKTVIKAAFPNHVLSHREYLTIAVTSGRPSGGAWFDSEVELMNERMVYGNAVFSPVSDGTTVPAQHTVCKSQLPLFAHRPDAINFRESYWLRDVVSASGFARVHGSGYANYLGASPSLGVRPAFSIS